MTILHTLARTMMATYFVANGVQALRRPESKADEMAVVVDDVVPVMKGVLPGVVADRIPSDATGLARLCGASQIVGGLCLATGVGRRLGAVVLTQTMVPAVLASNPRKAAPADRAERTTILLTNVALMGGTLLAAQDTQGKPSLVWRTKLRQEALDDAATQPGKRKKGHRHHAERAQHGGQAARSAA